MTRYLLIALALLCFSFTTVTVEFGSITYTRSNVFDIAGQAEAAGVEDEMLTRLRAMSASGAFDRQYQASFRPDAFRFDELPRAERSTTLPSGRTVTIFGDDFLSSRFTDLAGGRLTNSVEIGDKVFLVTGPAEAPDWTLIDAPAVRHATETGIDLKYAVAVTGEGDTLTAGYAPSLPVQVGPENYYGLPGAILTLEVKNGKRHYRYVATAIDLTTAAEELSPPTEGKSVTLEKFRELRDKYRARNAGPVKIVTRRL